MKTFKVQLLTVTFFVITLFTSCIFLGPSVKGDGNVTSEFRKVESFEKIDASRGINVYITQGDKQEVEVIADSNLHDAIETEVNNGTLKIYITENIRRAKEKKVIVTVDEIKGISSSAGSNVFSNNQLISKHMDISSSSGSNMHLEVISEVLIGKCSSGSNILISGKVRSAKLKASSGSNLRGENLHTISCSAHSSSGANLYIQVEEDLEASASSGGNVFYSGEPATTNFSSSSGGNIGTR